VATEVVERERRLEAKRSNWDTDWGSPVREQCDLGSASEVAAVFYWNMVLVRIISLTNFYAQFFIQ
jgi:hypothetical protein